MQNNHTDTNIIDAVIQNNPTALETLLNDGADPNFFEDEAHITLLHFAACFKSLECAKLLIERGANIHAKTTSGESVLDIAVLHGFTELMALLQRKYH